MSDKAQSSDEEAPESISFGKSREVALTVLKEAAEVSKGTSHKQKRAKEEKKKRRQERKDEKSKSEIIPDHIQKLNALREQAKEALADSVQTHQEKPRKPSVPKNTKKVFLEEHDDTSELEMDPSSGFIPLNGTKKINKRTSRDIESSGSSNLRVEIVSSKKPKVLAAESVINFRETMLYGTGSRVKRESAKVIMARKEKVRLSGKNVFCTS